jgi:hypothetical protein
MSVRCAALQHWCSEQSARGGHGHGDTKRATRVQKGGMKIYITIRFDSITIRTIHFL